MEKTLLCLSLAAISAGLIAFKPANASAKAADNAFYKLKNLFHI